MRHGPRKMPGKPRRPPSPVAQPVVCTLCNRRPAYVRTEYLIDGRAWATPVPLCGSCLARCQVEGRIGRWERLQTLR